MKPGSSIIIACLAFGIAPPAASTGPNQPARRRTQFDGQLLRESVSPGPGVHRNHGRQMLALADGSLVTALAWGTSPPVLRLWKGRALLAAHPLPGPPSAPMLVATPDGALSVWFSSGGVVYTLPDPRKPPVIVKSLAGTVEDAVASPEGGVLLALSRDGHLSLAHHKDGRAVQAHVDTEAGRAVLEYDEAGALHFVYEKRQGLEYRKLEPDFSLAKLAFSRTERAAEAFASAPALLAAEGRLFLAFLGESVRPPSPKRHTDAWERLGRGGYIGVLLRDKDQWKRFKVVASTQVAKSFWPAGPIVDSIQRSSLRVLVDELGAPALSLGPDGVPQVLWANTTRRWIYAARFLGDGFSAAAEVRGPLEQLTGAVLTPRRVPEGFAGIPVGMQSKTRTFVDEIRLPVRRVNVHSEKQIDFLQPDDLAEMRGLTLTVEEMKRRPENPVIRTGPAGSADEGGLVANIGRTGNRWEATYRFQKVAPVNGVARATGWQDDGHATSDDGITWTKTETRPFGDTRVFVEDPDEKDPSRRFKGLQYNRPLVPDGRGYFPVVSPDGKSWSRVPGNPALLIGDDDMRIMRDPDDVPERRFKAFAISWTLAGRTTVQWTSPDGVRWNDERENLDLDDPYGAPPYPLGTGRVLVDPWAGPPAEDESHGGYVFRDGDRWLLHYMPWTADGHIYVSLASSRDGINFTRVGSMAATLPLGEPGTWDAGRVAIREWPYRVGNLWRQYYTGSGWKHGIGGVGSSTSPMGINAPNQMGCAEIPVGRWGYLGLAPGTDTGDLVTTTLTLESPHALTVNLEGAERPGSKISCALLDPVKKAPIKGFDFAACDPIHGGGLDVPVRWRKKGIETLGQRQVRIALRITGGAVKLYGINLHPTR